MYRVFAFSLLSVLSIYSVLERVQRCSIVIEIRNLSDVIKVSVSLRPELGWHPQRSCIQ